MVAHEHDFQPYPGERGVYLCECGATGYRSKRTGEVVAHRERRELEPEPTVGLGGEELEAIEGGYRKRPKGGGE